MLKRYLFIILLFPLVLSAQGDFIGKWKIIESSYSFSDSTLSSITVHFYRDQYLNLICKGLNELVLPNSPYNLSVLATVNPDSPNLDLTISGRDRLGMGVIMGIQIELIRRTEDTLILGRGLYSKPNDTAKAKQLTLVKIPTQQLLNSKGLIGSWRVPKTRHLHEREKLNSINKTSNYFGTDTLILNTDGSFILIPDDHNDYIANYIYGDWKLFANSVLLHYKHIKTYKKGILSSIKDSTETFELEVLWYTPEDIYLYSNTKDNNDLTVDYYTFCKIKDK